MPGYLDHYGAGEDRRNRIVALSISGVVAVVVLTALGWYLFEHHHQESQVRQFLAAVKSGDYQTAYRIWGCTPEQPCKTYSIKNLMEDWGGPGAAAGSAPDPSLLRILDSESCNNGVLIKVAVNAKRQETLWVDPTRDGLGFAPYPVCPRKNPFAVMLHRTIGQLRKPFL
jgi:hypothetical protein